MDILKKFIVLIFVFFLIFLAYGQTYTSSNVNNVISIDNAVDFPKDI